MDKEPTPFAMRRWHDHDWEAILKGRDFAQRYFNRTGLVRKDRLCRFVPPGFHPATVVVRNVQEFLQGLMQLSASELETSKKGVVKYVLKKAQSSNAHGIRFLTDLEAHRLMEIRRRRSWAKWSLVVLTAAPVVLLAAFRLGARSLTLRARGPLLAATLAAAAIRFSALWPADWRQHELFQQDNEALYVLQRNVEPWLHHGRKFHLRVLLLCVGDLTAYVHEDVRALLASGSYRDGSGDSERLDVHVTNMAVNQAVSDYSAIEQNIPLKGLGEELASKVFAELSGVLAETLSKLREAGRRHFFTLPNCWELFGADFLVEAITGRAVLLEINPSPSLAMYSSDLKGLLGDDPLSDGFKMPQSWHQLQLQ